MDLGLKDRFFVVCGATSGFGKSIAGGLVREGARVLIIAREKKGLLEMHEQLGSASEILQGDLKEDRTRDALFQEIDGRTVDGILINAAGPPARSFLETSLEDWDEAYRSLLRWKADLLKRILPFFQTRKYGRALVVESISVKQPVENLILSTSLRMAVVGMIKTVSQEITEGDLTFNIMAPGYHDTPAVKRVLQKMSEVRGISYEEAQEQIIEKIPAGKMGDPDELASLALWLLSPHSGYVTGQTISVDGGVNRGVFG